MRICCATETTSNSNRGPAREPTQTHQTHQRTHPNQHTIHSTSASESAPRESRRRNRKRRATTAHARVFVPARALALTLALAFLYVWDEEARAQCGAPHKQATARDTAHGARIHGQASASQQHTLPEEEWRGAAIPVELTEPNDDKRRA